MRITGKTFRRRRADSESEEDEQESEEVRLKLEETREVQNLRKRPNGVRISNGFAGACANCFIASHPTPHFTIHSEQSTGFFFGFCNYCPLLSQLCNPNCLSLLPTAVTRTKTTCTLPDHPQLLGESWQGLKQRLEDTASWLIHIQLCCTTQAHLPTGRSTVHRSSAAALLVGEKVQEETTLVDDPFQMATGGMVDMKKLKERGKDKVSEEEDLHLGTSFSAETNRRDEDADMMKYIETELKKRKGIVEQEEQKAKPKNAEDCLYELPENIRVSSAKKTEEMLSNQMLSGIPEVDLGIDAKIKNIISTEDAKARLLAEQQNKKKDSETSFVPTNMAVNYVQHNRFYHEELNAPIRRNKEEPKARPLRVGDTEKPEPERSPPNRKRPANEKATDDYHYEKFKKMNRRY